MMPSVDPTLEFELELLNTLSGPLACMDEVGKGALGGPVTLGVVTIKLNMGEPPPGIKDSKLLAPRRRAELAPLVRAWATDYAVGHASAQEIDTLGIVGAQRLAAHRALAQLKTRPALILLDGSHDYVSNPLQRSMFDEEPLVEDTPPVITKIKADMNCLGVAAASILAKTERDTIMLALSEQYPQYGWSENKGYGSPEHLKALVQFGPSPQHRVSWKLPSQPAS